MHLGCYLWLENLDAGILLDTRSLLALQQMNPEKKESARSTLNVSAANFLNVFCALLVLTRMHIVARMKSMFHRDDSGYVTLSHHFLC